MNSRERQFAYVGLFLFGILIAMFYWWLKHYTHTIYYQRLILVSLFLGSLVVSLVLRFVRKQEREPMHPGAYVAITVLILAAFIPFVFLSNRYIGLDRVQNVEFDIYRIEAVHEAPYGMLSDEVAEINFYKITYNRDGKEQQMNLNAKYKSCIIDDKLVLPVRKGLWGFKQVILKKEGHENY